MMSRSFLFIDILIEMKKSEHEALVRRLLSMDDAEYWSTFVHYYEESPKEYLVTLLRGIGERNPLSSDLFRTLVPVFSEIDRQKIIDHLADSFTEPHSLLALLRLLGYSEPASWIPLLVKHRSLPSAFLLLQALRYVEEDKELLLRVARYLLRRGDSVAFNLASIMRLSFDIESLRGTFSLKMEPWQLHKMENDWNFFAQRMQF